LAFNISGGTLLGEYGREGAKECAESMNGWRTFEQKQATGAATYCSEEHPCFDMKPIIDSFFKELDEEKQ
jgi:hypothetical protein